MRVGREGLGVGEGQVDRPQDEAVDEDDDGREARRQHDLRQRVLQARTHGRRPAAASCSASAVWLSGLSSAALPSDSSVTVGAGARPMAGLSARGRRRARAFPAERGRVLVARRLLGVVDRLDEFVHGLVGGLDLAVDELR